MGDGAKCHNLAQTPAVRGPRIRWGRGLRTDKQSNLVTCTRADHQVFLKDSITMTIQLRLRLRASRSGACAIVNGISIVTGIHLEERIVLGATLREKISEYLLVRYR